MAAVMVDASVVLSAFDAADDESDASRAILESSSVTISTLDLARYEVANVAIRAWQSPADVAGLLAAVEQISEDGGVVRSGSGLLASAAAFAHEHDVSVYDAAYVIAARDAGHHLVSCDVRDLVSRGYAVLPSTFIDSTNG